MSKKGIHQRVGPDKTVPEALLEALPYLFRFNGKTFVIKYGGAAMTERDLQDSFAQQVVLLHKVGIKIVVVHGGGNETSHAMRERNLEPTFIHGKRITDVPAMRVVREVLGGRVNQDISRLIMEHGGEAIGISGLTLDLIRAVPNGNSGELGFVGDVSAVHADNIRFLLERFIPVIAPLGIGPEGHPYNINADDAASAIAIALEAENSYT